MYRYNREKLHVNTSGRCSHFLGTIAPFWHTVSLTCSSTLSLKKIGTTPCSHSSKRHVPHQKWIVWKKWNLVSVEVINALKENSIAKSTKYASEFGVTLRFCWLNEINLLKMLAYLDTSNQSQNMRNTIFIYRIYIRIKKRLSIWTLNIPLNFVTGISSQHSRCLHGK